MPLQKTIWCLDFQARIVHNKYLQNPVVFSSFCLFFTCHPEKLWPSTNQISQQFTSNPSMGERGKTNHQQAHNQQPSPGRRCLRSVSDVSGFQRSPHIMSGLGNRVLSLCKGQGRYTQCFWLDRAGAYVEQLQKQTSVYIQRPMQEQKSISWR